MKLGNYFGIMLVVTLFMSCLGLQTTNSPTQSDQKSIEYKNMSVKETIDYLNTHPNENIYVISEGYLWSYWNEDTAKISDRPLGQFGRGDNDWKDKIPFITLQKSNIKDSKYEKYYIPTYQKYIIKYSAIKAKRNSNSYDQFNGFVKNPFTISIDSLESIPIKFENIEYSQLADKIANTSEYGHGFIVNGYIVHPDWMYMTIGDTPAKNQGFGIYGIKNGIDLGTPDIDSMYRDINKRIDINKKYDVYIAAMQVDSYSNYRAKYNGIVWKIDGLETLEEATQRKAQEAEAQRLAVEEANKYNPLNFTLLPEDFKPSDYKKIDLFDAVSSVSRMQRGNGSIGDTLFGTLLQSDEVYGGLSSIQYYCSEVIFVSQSGTTIKFKTEDNAISQNMNISSRSGLTANQRVRIYYVVSKNPLEEWNVKAIEKL